MSVKSGYLFAFALALASGQFAGAAQISVAVASNFAAPMAEISAAFAKDTGHEIRPSLASSGKFYAQIHNGAPFEILLSADATIPARLERDGMTLAGSRFTYAIGGLVLWSADEQRVDAEGKILLGNAYGKLAIANPTHAPYGRAAIEVLTALGQHERVKRTFVMGENIGQAYQFVASGNAAIGFVAMSQVMRAGRLTAGSGWIVPATLHAPIRQDAVILKAGASNPAARALMDYLKGDQARVIMSRYGYRF